MGTERIFFTKTFVARGEGPDQNEALLSVSDEDLKTGGTVRIVLDDLGCYYNCYYLWPACGAIRNPSISPSVSVMAFYLGLYLNRGLGTFLNEKLMDNLVETNKLY